MRYAPAPITADVATIPHGMPESCPWQPFALGEYAFGGSELERCERWARHAAEWFDCGGQYVVDSETGRLEIALS